MTPEQKRQRKEMWLSLKIGAAVGLMFLGFTCFLLYSWFAAIHFIATQYP